MAPTNLTLKRRLLATAFAACLQFSCATLPSLTAQADAIQFTDSRGRAVSITSSNRIVSVGGAVTEILYALGAEDRIVGVDTTSLYPPQAQKDKPGIGYMRQLSPEGVLGLSPDLVLAAAGAGPKETLDALDAAKVPMVVVSEAFTEGAIIERIKMIAKVVGRDDRGTCLANAVSADLEWLRNFRGRMTAHPRVIFVMSHIDGRTMVAGHKTAADEIIKLAGGVNAISSFDGYKSINSEAIIAANPDVILTMERGQQQIQADALFADQAFALTPAAKSKSFISMDGHYLLGFGPRAAAAARDLAVGFNPSMQAEGAAFKPASLSVSCR